MSWTVHPMRERLGRTILFWVLVAFTIWAVYWNAGDWLFTAVAALFLLGSLSSFYLPTTYTIDADGVQMRRGIGSRRMEWSRVRSASPEPRGVFLSPFPLRSRLENFRGLWLPYRDNREEVLALVRRYNPGAFAGQEDRPKASDESRGV